MIDTIFAICCLMLSDLGKAVGMTYRQINVLIFCILWPLATLAMILVILRQRQEIKRLKQMKRSS